MKKIILSLSLFTALVVGLWWFGLRSAPEQTNRSQSGTDTETVDPTTPEDTGFDKEAHSISEPGSIWWIVNKDRPLGNDYVPPNLRDVDVTLFPGKPLNELQLRSDVAAAVEAMFAAAEKDNVELLLGSGYRSYDVQEFYYNNYVNTYGQAEADRFSARPGTSEHQTGLALDVSGVDRTCYLETCFEDQPAGVWVAENAHKYGFVIRYPDGKENITGYQYEPWHLRYVGVELASELREQGMTMEEFFEI